MFIWIFVTYGISIYLPQNTVKSIKSMRHPLMFLIVEDSLPLAQKIIFIGIIRIVIL